MPDIQTKGKAKANGNENPKSQGIQLVVPGFEPNPDESDVRNGIRQMRAGISQLLQGKKDERATVVQHHQQELAAITERHKAELAGVDDDIAVLQGSIDGLSGKPAPQLKALAPKKVQPRRVGRTTESGTATGFGVSLEAAAMGAATLLKLVAEKEAAGEPTTFTQKEFYRHPDLDWDQSKGSQSIRWYRAIGFIRRAGKDGSRGPELWAVMDADAVEREQRMARERTEEYERGLVAEDSAQDSTEDSAEDSAQDSTAGSASTPRDRLVQAVLAEGEIKGLTRLQELTGIPKGSLSALIKVLERENAINVQRFGKTRPMILTPGDK